MEELRPLLTTYAYNILGSWEEAKDTVQDVFLKFLGMNTENVVDKKSYLIRMVINLAIDNKERYKKRLSEYPGHWLPEAIETDGPDTPIHRREILSYSMMVLLEKLDSKQRAVFILKEAFDYDHDDIASLLGITVENSRKILSRARTDLQCALKPSKVDTAWLEKYITVMQSGDIRQVEQMLSSDITVISDGGGKATAFMNAIHGSKDVGALLSGLYRKSYSKARERIGMVNHQPALFYYDNDRLVTCQIFEITDGIVTNIFFIRNPDKLKVLEKTV